MKALLWIFLATVLAACGGRQESQSGIETETVLHLYGSELVGLEVSIAGTRTLIDKDKLVPHSRSAGPRILKRKDCNTWPFG